MSLLVWLPLKDGLQNYGTYDSTIGGTMYAFFNRALCGGTVTCTLPLDLFKTLHDFTVSYYVKFRTTTPSTHWIWQFGSQAANSVRGHYVNGPEYGNKLVWAGWSNDVVLSDIASSYDMKWHHICSRTYHDGAWKMETYIDGVSQGWVAINAPASTMASNVLTIMGYEDIRDFKVYDETLSVVEIIDDMNCPDFVLDMTTGTDISVNDHVVNPMSITHSRVNSTTKTLDVPHGNNDGVYYANKYAYEIPTLNIQAGLTEMTVIADVYINKALDTTTEQFCTILRWKYDLWFGVNCSFSNAWVFMNGASSGDNGCWRTAKRSDMLGTGAHTIAFVFNNGNFSMYLDGVSKPVEKTNVSGNMNFTAMPKTISAMRVNSILDGQTPSNESLSSNDVFISRVRAYYYAVPPKMIEHLCKPQPFVNIGRLGNNAKVITSNDSIGFDATKSNISIGAKSIDAIDMSDYIYDPTSNSIYYPLTYHVFDVASGPWFSSSTIKTAPQYTENCWSRLHLLNSSLSGNIISSIEPYSFLLLQGKLNDSSALGRWRWKQTVNPLTASRGDVLPANITWIEGSYNSAAYKGGIYYDDTTSRLLRQGHENSYSYGLLQSGAYSDSVGTRAPAFGGHIYTGTVVQILAIRLYFNVTLDKGGHLWKNGQLSMSSLVEIQ